MGRVPANFSVIIFARLLVALLVGEAHVHVTVIVALLLRVLEQAAGFVLQLLHRLSRVPGLHVPLQVPPPHQHLAAEVAPVRGVSLRVQSDVLVQVARVSEGPEAHLALERFVTCVSSHVDFQPVFSRVQFAAVQTQVSLFRFAGAGVAGGSGRHRVQPRPVLLRRDFGQLLGVHGDLPVDVGDGAQVLIQRRRTKVGHGLRVLEEVSEVELQRIVR